MRPLITITLVFLLAAGINGCKDDSKIRVTRLSCEYLTDPLGIDAREPQLSWQLKSEQRGQRQTEGDLWDSGKLYPINPGMWYTRAPRYSPEPNVSGR